MSNAVAGEVAEGFGPVADVFRASFASGEELGAAVAVYRDGVPVVDLWGGLADRERGTPWNRDTVALVFSTTKGLVSMCFLVLADRGMLDYDAPIGRYWPELGRMIDGTVRMLLNHRAGTTAIDAPLHLADFSHPERVAMVLETQPANWIPGTAQGYGATAWGIYAGELFRRVAGESVGSFFRRQIADPLGLQTWIGTPPEVDERVARLYPLSTADRVFRQFPSMLRGGVEGRVFRNVALFRNSFTRRALQNPVDIGPSGMEVFNDPRVRRVELPWCNAITDARSVARAYAALVGTVDGVRLVSEATVAPLRPRQTWELDRVMCKPMGWSQGFLKDEPTLFSPNPSSFGHPGTGGALGWCDPDAKVTIGYVMNRLDWRIRSPRALALCHALYRCIGR